MRKRVRGSGEFIAAMLCLVVLMAVAAYNLRISADSSMKTKLDEVCRSYILELETAGDMSTTEVTDFKNRVKNSIIDKIGSKVDAESISVSVTTGTYGQDVTLKVECNVKLSQSKIKSVLSLYSDTEVPYTRYVREIKSTSKA